MLVRAVRIAEAKDRGLCDVIERELDKQSEIPGLVLPFTSSVTMAWKLTFSETVSSF